MQSKTLTELPFYMVGKKKIESKLKLEWMGIWIELNLHIILIVKINLNLNLAKLPEEPPLTAHFGFPYYLTYFFSYQ